MMEDGHGFCRVSHFRYFLVPVVLLIVQAMVKLACPPCPLIILIRLQLREPETASSRLAILYTGVGALGSGRAKRKQLLRHVVEEGHKPTEKNSMYPCGFNVSGVQGQTRRPLRARICV